MRSQARILVVGDEVNLDRAIARVLRLRGYEVVVAHAGTRAHEVEGIFDCGVFDFEPRDAQGPKQAEHLLRAVAVRRVVFFAGSIDETLRTRAERLGPIVEKSEGMVVLLFVIASVVNALEAVARAVGDPNGAHGGGFVPEPLGDPLMCIVRNHA